MKRRALKSKQDYSFLSSAKRRKELKNDNIRYYLQKWIISHPHVIKFTISNDYITIKFDNINVNRGVRTELYQNVLL